MRSYFNGLDLTGTTKSRARVTLAGAIIATIALFGLLLAVRDCAPRAGRARGPARGEGTLRRVLRLGSRAAAGAPPARAA